MWAVEGRYNGMCWDGRDVAEQIRSPEVEVSRNDVLASLMEMFPPEDWSQGNDGYPHKDPYRDLPKTLQMAPQAISRSKTPICNIECEQLWSLLDKRFGYGVTLVIMQYWANEQADDLFDNDILTHGKLKGAQVNQVNQVNQLARLGQDDFRQQALSGIREIFKGPPCQDYQRDFQHFQGDFYEDMKDEEMKDEEMADDRQWNEEAPSSGFEGLFHDDGDLLPFGDDGHLSGRLITTGFNLEARADAGVGAGAESWFSPDAFSNLHQSIYNFA